MKTYIFENPDSINLNDTTVNTSMNQNTIEITNLTGMEKFKEYCDFLLLLLFVITLLNYVSSD